MSRVFADWEIHFFLFAGLRFCRGKKETSKIRSEQLKLAGEAWHFVS
jgi:hypothetical protein